MRSAEGPPLPASKKFLFFILMNIITLSLIVLSVEGYYLFGFLSFKDDYCRSFARLDEEIGWVLKASTISCITNGIDPADPNAFSSTVHINADGSRTKSISSSTPSNALLAIGDSWTFGYGIDWEETFAAQLSRNHGWPTALLASPAYSGVQALLLAQRHIYSIRPTTIIYLELGFWERAVCSGKIQPIAILKPCYWVDSSGSVHLVKPSSGYVYRMSSLGLRPGGMVGAGEKTLTYFLIARPIAKIKQMLVRAGLLSGFGNDFAAWGRKEDFASMRAAHLEQLLSLADGVGAKLLLIDPGEVYRTRESGIGRVDHLIYVGASKWNTFVKKPMSQLSPAEARVPGDGHYGPGTHRLIAALIDEMLTDEK